MGHIMEGSHAHANKKNSLLGPITLDSMVVESKQ